MRHTNRLAGSGAETSEQCRRPIPVIVSAVQHMRRMRGGAQSHLMRCSDGNFYVVKFRNNPQHVRVLTNEMLGTALASAVDLPVPAVAVVEVGQWLIKRTAELCMRFPNAAIPCEAGLHFGAQYVVNPLEGQVFDYLPTEMLSRVRNRETFAGMLAIDKWTSNSDGRQATFWRRNQEKKYRVSFIDQGYFFNAGEWTFPDHPLRGVYPRNEVYEGVSGWGSFEPWLSRIESMDETVIWERAGGIPPEWYGGDWSALESLGNTLLERRAKVRDLISAFRFSVRQPFPNWADRSTGQICGWVGAGGSP